jgi:DNA repair protein RecN (Recombination protein N)
VLQSPLPTALRPRLQTLTLHQVAVFQHVKLACPDGLVAILGEAGSGKSLLIDALDWLFGAAVSAKQVLRHGCNSAWVEATLQVPLSQEGLNESPLWQLLEAHQLKDVILEELEPDAPLCELTLRREWSLQQSRCKVQGVTVPRAVLEALRACFIDIQSQHAAVELFKAEAQRESLDVVGGASLAALKQSAIEALRQWRALQRQQQNQQQLEVKLLQEKETLLQGLATLEAAALTHPKEDEQVRQSVKKQTELEGLRRAVASALAALQGGEAHWQEGQAPAKSAIDGMDEALKHLRQAERLDEELQSTHTQLDEAYEAVKTCAYELETYYESLLPDPEGLQHLMERLEVLERVKRLHGGSLANALAYLQQADERCLAIEEALSQLGNLDALEQEAQTQAMLLFGELTQQRKALAERLTVAVQERLQALALPYAQFSIAVEKATEWSEANGADVIRFLFSANPGEPLQPLSQVASGGELSRVLLALKTARQAFTGEGPAILVFDEIDTGTSGQAAQAMAQQLLVLASHPAQVLVITHQPLVAAYAQAMLWVSKEVVESDAALVSGELLTESRTQAKVAVLTQQAEKVQALTHLAAGDTTGNEAIESYVKRLMQEANLPSLK